MSNPVPEWSGVFLATEDNQCAVMRIHNDDQRFHRPPMGWNLIDVIYDDEGDADIYVYKRR